MVMPFAAAHDAPIWQDFDTIVSKPTPTVSSLPCLTFEPEPTGCELVSLRDTAARVVRSRHGGSDAEDLVQEAWARVALALRDRPVDDPHAYTAGVAANLVRGRYRQDRRRQRRTPLLFMRSTVDAPDGQIVRQEEADALVTALGRLPEPARMTLVAHVVDGLDTATLASRAGTSPGAVAACLARSRAMLRVEYLIAFRHLPDPPERCRRVCYAISGNDTRREQRLDATGHVRTCDACREITETLRERRRPAMLGALALRLSGWTSRWAASDWQQRAPRAGLVGAGVVGAGMVVALGSVLVPTAPGRAMSQGSTALSASPLSTHASRRPAADHAPSKRLDPRTADDHNTTRRTAAVAVHAVAVRAPAVRVPAVRVPTVAVPSVKRPAVPTVPAFAIIGADEGLGERLAHRLDLLDSPTALS